MAILTVLALLFSLLLSRWLTRPLVQLSQVTANLPEKLSGAQNLDWPAGSSLEINALIANSKSMAHTLEENFHNLQVQADELTQANRGLAQEVLERQQAEDSPAGERRRSEDDLGRHTDRGHRYRRGDT